MSDDTMVDLYITYIQNIMKIFSYNIYLLKNIVNIEYKYSSIHNPLNKMFSERGMMESPPYVFVQVFANTYK